MMKNHSDNLLDNSSEGQNTCRQCNTSYKDFPSLLSHTCRPNRCKLCPATFDMDYQLVLHENNCHTAMNKEDSDTESVIAESTLVSTLDANSRIFLNCPQSCDSQNSCKICKKSLRSHKNNQFCPNCLVLIKKDDCNLGFSNGSLSNKKILPNYVTPKNTLNASVTDLKNKLMLVSADFTINVKDKDNETSVTNRQLKLKRKRNGYMHSSGRSIEESKWSAMNGKRNKNIDGSEQNIHNLKTKLKHSNIKYLQHNEKNSTNVDVPSTSKCVPVHSFKLRKNFMKKGICESNKLISMKQRHGEQNRRAETTAKSSVNSPFHSALQRPQSKVLNSSHEEQGNQSRTYSRKSTAESHLKSPSSKVSLSSLIDSLPDNDCGILLQSTNESNFKCSKCNKVFRSPKFASAHFSACKVSRLKKIEVELAEVKWVCSVCHSHFIIISDLMKHRRICSGFQLQAAATKQNLVATISNYEHACVNWCPKCSYRCLSSFSLQNHSCQEKIKYMRSCFVLSHKLPAIDCNKGEYLYECRLCKKVFNNNFRYSRHISSHATCVQFENVSPLRLNPIYNPEVVRNIKTEVVKSPEDTEFEKALKTIHTVLTQTPILDLQTLMNQLASDKKDCCARSENSEPMPSTSGAPCTLDNNLFNFLKHASSSQDSKQCFDSCHNLSCNKHKPAEVSNITQVGKSSLKMAGATTVDPVLTTSELDTSVRHENSPFLLDINSIESSTSSVSQSGLIPPPMPDNPSTHLPNTNSNGPAISHLILDNEHNDTASTCINSDSGEEDEMQIDPTPSVQEPVPIRHIWSDENVNNIDAWAILSSTDSNTVEKYICPVCFTSHDQNSLSNHLRMKHRSEVTEIIALYMEKF